MGQLSPQRGAHILPLNSADYLKTQYCLLLFLMSTPKLSNHLLVILLFALLWMLMQSYYLLRMMDTASASQQPVPLVYRKSELTDQVSQVQDNFSSLLFHQSTNSSILHASSSASAHQKDFKVAILIPYLGSTLPVWFQSFLFYAQFGPILNWLIFVTNSEFLNIVTPLNVVIVYIPADQFYHRFLSVDEKYISTDSLNQKQWRRLFAECVRKFPYLIVEFKPCLGYIFSDYLKEYSHWGYADIDILSGRFSRFLTADILNQYDIYTSSFGDVTRMYLRGQLTIFRKTDQLLYMWQHCLYFKELTSRIMKATKNRWSFESAEGCISKAAFESTNLSVFVASSQLSDAFRAPTKDKEAFFLGNALLRCYERPILSSSNLCDATLSRNENSSLEYLNSIIFPHDLSFIPSVHEEGKTYSQSFAVSENADCMYWIKEKYQVCLKDNIFSRNESFIWNASTKSIRATKIKSHVLPKFACEKNSPGQCREGWKKGAFYQFNTRVPSLDTHLLLITQQGFIPLIMNLNVANHTIPTLKRLLDDEQDDYYAMTTTSYYCQYFSNSLKSCESHIWPGDIEVYSFYSSVSSSSRLRSMTLVMATSAVDDDVTSGVLLQSMTHFEGSQIVTLGYTTAADKQEIINYIDNDLTARLNLTRINLKDSNCRDSFVDHFPNNQTHQQTLCLFQRIDIVTVRLKDSSRQRKCGVDADYSLFNIALDRVRTKRVILSPVGVLFPSGMAEHLRKSLSAPNDRTTPRASKEFVSKAIILPICLSKLSPQSTLWNGTTMYPPGMSKQEAWLIKSQYKLSAAIQCGLIANNTLSLGSSMPFKMLANMKEAIYPFPSTKTRDLFSSKDGAMIPVAFNVRGNAHGERFMRLPEELNGFPGRSSVIFGILKLCGYDLYMSTLLSSLVTISNTDQNNTKNEYDNKAKNSSDFLSEVDSNHQAAAEALLEKSLVSFTDTTMKYFQRVEQLRSKGLQDLYARHRFEGNYFG